MSARYDVAVVGAGPAGSTAAARLAEAGWRVALVDRAVFPRHKPCGDYLNALARRLLDGLGVLPTLRDRGSSDVAGMTVYAQDGSAFTGTYTGSLGLAVRRRDLDATLVDVAERRGARLVERFRVEAVTDGGDGRVVEGRRGGQREALGARLVIGADGMRSRVAASLGLARPPVGARYGLGTYVVGLEPRTPAQSGPDAPQGAHYGEMHTGGGFYCGVAWFADGAANVTMSVPRALLDGFRDDPDRRFRALLRRLPGLAGRVERIERVAPFSVTGPLVPRRHRASAERALLVGDAAAFLDPLTGPGVAAALWSGEVAAAVASAALDDGDLSARRLAVYDRARRAELGLPYLATQVVHSVVFRSGLFPRIAARLRARPASAERVFGALGWARPVRDLLSPALLASLVL